MNCLELKAAFQKRKGEGCGESLTAHIIFTVDSFDREHPLLSHTMLSAAIMRLFGPIWVAILSSGRAWMEQILASGWKGTWSKRVTPEAGRQRTAIFWSKCEMRQLSPTFPEWTRGRHCLLLLWGYNHRAYPGEAGKRAPIAHHQKRWVGQKLSNPSAIMLFTVSRQKVGIYRRERPGSEQCQRACPVRPP